MHTLRNKKYIVTVITGIILRLLFAIIPGFKIDVDSWFAWAIRLSNFNYSQFYSKDVFTDYTPGYLYTLSILGYLKNSLGLQDSLFYFLLKIPAITADLIIGTLIYQEVKKYLSQKMALVVLALVLFNPVIIFNSSIWGQIDSILALFLLLTILALNNQRLISASISFGLSLLIKPQAIALVPLFALFLIRNFGLSVFLKLAIPALITVFILSFPFFPTNTLINLTQHILNTANEYSFTSVNAYNLWGVVGFWINDSQLWNSFSYQLWGYVLLTIYWAIISYFYFKKRLSIFALATLATLSFFFLPTRVHERYLYPALVFLALLAAMYKSRLFLAATVLLSIVHFLNLYYVYVYYNEFYLRLPKTLYHPLLYDFVSSNSTILSIVSTIIFILISIFIIKYDTRSNKN